MSDQKQHCGLFTSTQVAIPLEGVRIEAHVTGRCSEVTVTQRYVNAEAVDVEAVYVFPLEEGAAVSGFRAKVGDRVIEGRVEERERAFEVYDDAMADGHGAFLLDQERPNVFTASVGNLKPGSAVEVTVSYVALLNLEGAAARLMLPTTVSPRYVPKGAPEVGEPDGERVNPPRLGSVPYGLEVEVIVDTAQLKGVESPSHAVRTRLESGRAVVELSSDKTALDRDFILLIETAETGAAQGQAAREEDGTRVAMVTFRPGEGEFGEVKNEVVFVIDCSGSMQGESIEQARRALALCLRGLSEGDTFNIVRFGSTWERLWPAPKPYNQGNLDEATRYTERINADLGGTEVLEPFQALMGEHRGRTQQLLLLTDGQVSNEAEVIALCKANEGKARVFSFGIGAGVSEHLVRGVARASGGAAEFIYPGERIEPKVLRMFKRVRTPAFQSVRIEWGGMEVEQAPVEVPPVFAGEAVTVFARVRSGQASEVTLHADDKRWTVALDLETAQAGSPLPKLWARHAIRDLEDGKSLRRGSNQRRGGSGEDDSARTARRVLELGQRYGLMSSLTSYVAVEVRAEADKSAGQAQLRRVPVALTKGWGGSPGVQQGMVYGGGGALRAMMAPTGAPPMPSRKMAPPSTGAFAPPPPPGAPMPAPAPAPMAARAQSVMPSAPPMMDFMEMEAERATPAPARRGGSVMDRARSFIGGLFGDEGGGEKAKEARRERADGGPRYEAAPELEECDEALESPPASGAGSLDAMFDLLMTQRADGAFVDSAALRRWVDGAKLEAAAKQHDALAAATAAALAVLERHFGGHREEWEVASDKATAWLKRHGVSLGGEALLR